MRNNLGHQKTFDTVVKAIIKQGKRSIIDGVCQYRGPNGYKCAAGHLIPDSDYKPEWEGSTVTAEEISACLKKEGHNLGLVKQLQMCHDGFGVGDDVKFIEHFLEEAEKVAKNFKLNCDALN